MEDTVEKDKSLKVWEKRTPPKHHKKSVLSSVLSSLCGGVSPPSRPLAMNIFFASLVSPRPARFPFM